MHARPKHSLDEDFYYQRDIFNTTNYWFLLRFLPLQEFNTVQNESVYTQRATKAFLVEF